jgi:hypothetical protein
MRRSGYRRQPAAQFAETAADQQQDAKLGEKYRASDRPGIFPSAAKRSKQRQAETPRPSGRATP